MLIPKMDASQTKKLVTRLSSSTQDEEYGKQLDRQSSELKSKN